LFKKIKLKIFSWLGLRDHPAITVYNGFGNADCVNIIGHVLDLSPRPRKTFNSNWFRNFFSVIRLFIVSPVNDAVVLLKWGEENFQTTTESDGFFRFEFCPKLIHEAGWHNVEVFLDSLSGKTSGHGSVYIPHQTQVAFISDIDDTFLISHTSKLRKRLYVLLTRNERSRKAFAGVINHYQLLANSGAVSPKETNPFFYVSSSEWNLYHFLLEFIDFNKLPKGVFLLGQMKKLKDFWRSGQNNHSTKFMRIVRIIEAYPSQRFVLLGDDSQQDPVIYKSITEHFPDKILAVYLRRVRASNFDNVTKIVEEIKGKGVEVCYFEHSSEAVIHSKNIGLILA
jgi:phosphatidate phosphatase APP1